MEIPSDPTSVAGDAVVAVVAAQDRGQAGVLALDRLVPVVLAPFAHCRQSAGEPALCRHLPHHVLALQGPPPDMGEAQEVEGGTARRRVALAARTAKAEVDEPRLLRMESESISVQPLTQSAKDPLGVEVIL